MTSYITQNATQPQIACWMCVYVTKVMWPGGGQLTLTGVDGDGEALHRGHGEGAEQRADADVDQNVGLAKTRT